MSSTAFQQGHAEEEEDVVDLASFVSPLVDAISQLILCAVGESRAELTTHVQNVASFTNKVVLAAKDIALQSHDREIQRSITMAINKVAGGIEKLVISLTSFLKDSKNPEKQREFALATKSVGDHINELVVAADSTAITKILDAVADARDAQRRLFEASQVSVDDMVAAARFKAQCVKHLSEVVSTASSQTGDQKKARLLQESLGDTQASIGPLFRAMNELAAHPQDSSLKRRAEECLGITDEHYEKLCEAARIVPNYSQAFEDAYDYVRRLVELALSLQEASRNLLDVISDPNHTREMFLKAARQAAETAKRLIRQAELALERTTDPARRAQIRELIDQLREASAELIKAARAASADPNNPDLRRNVVEADKRLQALIQKMVALTSPDDEDAENKLLFTSQYLDGLMEQLCGRAADLSRQELLDFARRIVQASKTLAKDARAVAEQTADPKQRQEILDAVAEMESTCAEVVRAISALAENPGDPKLVARLKELKEKFNYAVHRVRAAAGLEELRHQKKVIDLSQRNEDPLVAAARRQAQEALALADEAEALAHGLRDPAKRRKVLEAVELLRSLAAKVLEAAQAAAENPNDPDLQRALDEAQQELNSAIRGVIMLTSEHEAALQRELELLEQAARMDEDDANAYMAAQDTMRLVRDFLAKLANMTPQELVACAKDIATRATELAKLLRRIASKIDPPENKQLLNCASLLCDRAIQVKMLAAVSAASGSTGDESGQVTSSANVLMKELTESVNVLRRAALKRRVKRTNKQTDQLRRVIAAWQAAREKQNI